MHKRIAQLYEHWAGSTSPQELKDQGYDNLLLQVTSLYNAGWTEDGEPEVVAKQLWSYITSYTS